MISAYHLVRDKTQKSNSTKGNEIPVPLNEILSCMNRTKRELRTSVFNLTTAVSKQIQLHHKELFLFPFPPNKALIMEVSMRKNRPIPWAAARSNLVGKPTSSWHVTVARGGEAKTYVPNFRYAIRSRKRLVQSNSTLNTLSPSGSPSMVLATRGYVQWTFSL